MALRSYLPADHPDKHLEIGSEATPADFLDVLLDLTEEWARVLAPHGSICVELGDTYAGSGGAGGDYSDGGLREGQQSFDGSGRRGSNRVHGEGHRTSIPARRVGSTAYTVPTKGRGWPLDKSLCGIPTLFAWSLAYGRNLLRPERTTDPWRIRNVVAWCRPNPPVGALGDKFRPATSYMTIATKARNRWFDLDAVRSPSDEPVRTVRVGMASASKGVSGGDSGNPDKPRPSHNPAGAPPLDWWEIPIEPYKGSHYATWPRRLLERPILAMCPQRVCTVCGEPSRRITGEAQYVTAHGKVHDGIDRDKSKTIATGFGGHSGKRDGATTRVAPTLGWSDCGCTPDGSHWRNGVVLDPFAGTGTTLAVATGHGRDAIGIDIDERNADLALERIGPLLLTVERHRREGAA